MSARIPPHPAHYLHGDGSVVVVPARAAAWMLRRTDLRQRRTAHRGADPEIDAVLMAVMIAGQKWAADVKGSDPRKPTEIVSPSEWMDPEEVATVLQVSSSRVRQELRSGYLVGEKRGRFWRVHRTELAHYTSARTA